MATTILVVDDTKANVKLLEAKLVKEYYVVLTARNGLEALEVLKTNKIDIVLLDLRMPVMDGFEACKKIKNTPETALIPVVIVTSETESQDRIKALELGADDFLTKPINTAALFSRIKSLANMKSIIDELKLRNKINETLGGPVIEIKQDFTDSKILIIDDDIIQAKNVKNNLLPLTNHIKSLADPKKIDTLGSFLPDLIIISCQLDIADPLRVSVGLRAQEKFKYASLILLAEEENEEDTIKIVMKGMELGVNDYFFYPLDETELQARIKIQLRNKHNRDDLRKQLEENVSLSTKDGLTGVFNRRYFDIHIEQMIQTSRETKQPMCLMMFDVDYFKNINDKYGHQSGDIILKTLSKTIKNLFKVTDLIARYGGEEFVVLLSNSSLSNARKVAERIRSAIANTDFITPLHGTPIRTTISIGLTEYNDGDSSELLISKADKALYEAKQKGRNSVVVS